VGQNDLRYDLTTTRCIDFVCCWIEDISSPAHNVDLGAVKRKTAGYG